MLPIDDSLKDPFPRRSSLLGPANSPTVRLTLEHMKYEICQIVNLHLEDMKDAVERAVMEALSRFDFKREVETIAHHVIREELERAVKQAITASIWTEDVRRKLEAAAAQALKEKFNLR